MSTISKKNKNRMIIMLIGGYLFLGFAFFRIPDHLFHIYFLNVGQGDSIFIKTPENHQILIDGGPLNNVLEELTYVMPFFDKSLDLVVLTHPHADHVEGLVEVIKRFDVQNILYTGVDYPNPAYAEFLKEIHVQDINFFIAGADTDFLFGDVLFDTIYPFHSISGDDFENINNSSIALKVQYGEKKILLTGDLEARAEMELVNSGVNLEAHILKAGHHGSRTASTPEFLKRVKPNFAVIQCGVDNKFSHPHEETIKNLYRADVGKIYRNDIDGRIEFVF